MQTTLNHKARGTMKQEIILPLLSDSFETFSMIFATQLIRDLF